MKSIMQSEQDDECYLCHQYANYTDGALEWHHIFGGTANRKKSEQYGLKVRLHGIKCHRLGPMSQQKNKEIDLILKVAGQRKFEETHTRKEFRQEFGKNRLSKKVYHLLGLYIYHE